MPLKCTRRRCPLALSASAVRLHKAGQTKIPKHCRHARTRQKSHMLFMIRSRRMHRRSQPPRRPTRSHSEQPKKDPSYFQPKHRGEFYQRLAHRRAKPSAAFLQSPPSLLHLSRRSGHPVAQPGGRLHLIRHRWPRTRTRLRRRIRSGRRIHRGLGCLCRQPRSNPQYPPKANRIHKQSVSFRSRP
jgi:hypothetical protein